MIPIEDWGGFEEFVAELHQTGTVSVQHDVTINDRHGIPRQIDVLITHRTDFYKHLIIVECKCWNKSVPRSIVDALAKNIEELRASKGAIFTTKGFQKGAKKAAEVYGIDLFKVRPLKDEEWLFHQRSIPLFGQHISRGIGMVKVSNIKALDGATLPAPLLFPFTSAPPQFTIPTGQHGYSVLQLAEALTLKQLRDDIASKGIIFDCSEGEVVFLRAEASLIPPSPIVIPLSKGCLEVSRVDMELGLKFKQVRLDIDQNKAFKFIVALEECVSGHTRQVWRGLQEKVTEYKIGLQDALPNDHSLRNGIVMHWYQIKPFEYSDHADIYTKVECTAPVLFQAFPACRLPGMPEWRFT